MQNIENHVLSPLLNPPTTPPPLFFFFFFFFFFGFFKNLLRLKLNILSSVYPEINFPAEHVMKINNLSRPKVPAPPPPPLRIKWSSPNFQISFTPKFWRIIKPWYLKISLKVFHFINYLYLIQIIITILTLDPYLCTEHLKYEKCNPSLKCSNFHFAMITGKTSVRNEM